MIRYLSILLILGSSVLPTSVLTGESADSTDANHSADPYMTKEFNLSNSGMLKVFTTAGNIDVIPSSSTQKVKVELYIDQWSGVKSQEDDITIVVMKAKK